MMEVRNSVSTKLIDLIPGIKIVKCSCHIQHLCARDAIKVMPSIYEEIVNQIHNYFVNSSSRVDRLTVLQGKSFVKDLKIFKPVVTRWLSYFDCMYRIQSRWAVLTKFFSTECLQDDNVAAAKPILDYLHNPLSKLYHEFLVSVYLNYV